MDPKFVSNPAHGIRRKRGGVEIAPTLRLPQRPIIEGLEQRVLLSAVVNGSFETGDLTGWRSDGNASIQDSSFGITPTNGNYEALISNGAGSLTQGSAPVSATQLATDLSLPSSYFTAQGYTNGSLISQQVTIGARDQISFDYTFLTDETTDGTGQPDAAMAVLVPSSPTGAAQLLNMTPADLGADAQSAPAASGFDFASSPASHGPTAFGTAGTYTLSFVVFNYGDTYAPSALVVDNVAVETFVPASTTTAVTSSKASSTIGQSVTLTATVTPTSGSGESGTVQFQIDGRNAGSPVTLSGNTATYTTSALNPGSHSVVAVYGGDSNFAASTSPTFWQNVSRIVTNTAVTSSNPSAAYGQGVTVTATIAPAGGGNVTGTVQFQIDRRNVGSPVNISGNTATYALSSLPAGSHSLVAVYSGDGTYSSSTSPALSQQIAKATTTTAVTSSNASPLIGQSVTFTAMVTPVSGSGDTGSVQFQIDGHNAGSPVSLSGNTAIYATSSLSAGTHSIVALYSGDGNFASSVSPALTQIMSLPATVSGTVFSHTKHGNTPFAGVTVTLQQLGKNGRAIGHALNTVSNSKGAYLFSGLVPATYLLSEQLPAGYGPTSPAAGSYTFNLLSGQVVSSMDFIDTLSSPSSRPRKRRR